MAYWTCKSCKQQNPDSVRHCMSCGVHRRLEHQRDCRVSQGGKFCTCDYHKRLGRIGDPKKLDDEQAEKERALKELIHRQQQELEKLRGRGMRQKRYDASLYVVTITHPTLGSGSHYSAEVPGTDAKDAAQSYIRVMEDNAGADLARKDPEITIVCVIDPTLGQNGKPWKVHLFSIVVGLDMYGRQHFYAEEFM